MAGKSWVFSALLCNHCNRVIYGHQSLRNNVRRSLLEKGAREVGGVKSHEDWYCCRGCRTAHQISPGMKNRSILLSTT